MPITVARTGEAGGTAVGAASTEVLAANNGRVGLILVNDSDETIYVSFGEPAALNQGIRLNANGGSYTMDGALVYLGAVTAICAAGPATLAHEEFLA